jgi:hypothetical protein
VSPDERRERGESQQHKRRRLRYDGIRTGGRAPTGRLAEMVTPYVVGSLRSNTLSPDDVVGGVDGAVLLVVLGDLVGAVAPM